MRHSSTLVKRRYYNFHLNLVFKWEWKKMKNMKFTIEFIFQTFYSSYNWNQFHHFLPGEIMFPKMLEEFVLFKYTWLSSIIRVVNRKDGWVTKTIPPKRAMTKIKDLEMIQIQTIIWKLIFIIILLFACQILTYQKRSLRLSNALSWK